MGIHICLYLKNKERDHPDWDYIRVVNDRDFTSLVDWDEVQKFEGDDVILREDGAFRPLDLDEFRKRINATDWQNKDRYHHLLDLVERDDAWIYISY